MKIDFGSGYNPEKDYLTCDPFHPMSDVLYDYENYKIDLDQGTVTEIRCRNVLHHVKNLKRLFKEFYRVLKPTGIIKIIEPTEEAFKVNLFLDLLWYRFISKRNEIWISKKYVNYIEIGLRSGFKCYSKRIENEKEISTLTTLKEVYANAN